MEVRRLLVLVAAILGATACLAESSSSSSLTSTRYVHLNGEDGQGREVDIVWGPASGAVDTVYGAGVSDCLWFQNDYAVHRGVSGDVDVLPGRDAAVQQARRIFLAGAYTALVPVRAVEGEGARAILYHAPGGIDVVVRSAIGYPVSQASVGTTQFANLQFDRDYAVGWHEIDLLTFQQKTFRRRGGLENIDAFPPEPRSPWARGNVADGPVVAAVAQRPARLLVRTGIRGLFVSRDFAHQVGAKVVDPQGSIVLLPDVVIAGNRVHSVAARVTKLPDYDLAAGMGILPQAALIFDRAGHATATHHRCQRPHKLESGSLPILRGPDAVGKDVLTLVDSGHSGPPVFEPRKGLRLGARCTNEKRVLSFQGERFGSDAWCPTLTSLQAGETLLPQINAVVGLSSLGAKNLLIDMPRREACWF